MYSEKEFLQQIDQNQNIIHKVCNLYADNPVEREDLFQEVLLNAWKGIGNFRGEAKFTTWLYRVALNTAITFFRKEMKRARVDALDHNLYALADEAGSQDDQLKAMHLAISDLSRIDKALVMLYLDNYNHSEIGEMLGISANNVAVKLNRLKIKLRDATTKYLKV